MVVLINPHAGKSGSGARPPETQIAALFILIEQPEIGIERRLWRRDSGAFEVLSVEPFHRSEGGWIRE